MEVLKTDNIHMDIKEITYVLFQNQHTKIKVKGQLLLKHTER